MSAMTDDKGREELKRKLRSKNLILLAVLLAFVVLVYFVSIVRMGATS